MATSKIKGAPPTSNLGGSAYSSDIARHKYAPARPPRKSKVKRDITSQFLLCKCAPDLIVPFKDGRYLNMDKAQSATLSGEIAPAMGKPISKSIDKMVRWKNPPKRRRTDVYAPKGVELTPAIAAQALARINAQKQAKAVAMYEGKAKRLERERKAEEMRLANLRAVAHLHVKAVERKAKERNAFKQESKFGIGDAFAKVGL